MSRSGPMDQVNVELLIALVRERPLIWDKTLAVYRNKPLRDKTWREVCALLKDDYNDLSKAQRYEYGKIVLKKWTQIRDSCCKYIKKKKTKKKSLTKPYKYFYDLSFLEKVANISFSQLNETNDDRDEDTEGEEKTSEDEEETEYSNRADVLIYSEDEMPYEGSSGTIIKEESNTDMDALPRNAFGVTNFLNSANVVNTVVNKEDDPNLHFFKGILPIVSTLNTDEVLQFQSGVLNLLQTIKKQRKGEFH